MSNTDNKLLNSVLQSSSVCVVETSALTGEPIHTASNNISNILGYNAQELSDNSVMFDDLIHEDDIAQKLQSNIQVYNEQCNNDYLAKIKRNCLAGTIDCCVLLYLSDLKHGVDGCIVLYGDKLKPDISSVPAVAKLFQQSIIDRLIAQKYKRLNQDREEFQELIADTQDYAIFAKDIDARIVYANETFLSFYPPEAQDSVIGFTTVEDDDEQQRKVFLENDKKAFADGVNKVIETINFLSGERRVLETTKTRFTTRTGGDYILGISYNLTEQYELIRMLQAKNVDLDEVANMLASDVRAPANSMLKLIKWLQDDVAFLENEEINDNLAQLNIRAKRVCKLLASLHDYCFAGRDKQTSVSINLSSCVSDTLAALQHNVKAIVADKAITLPFTAFQKVLSALVDNAVTHNTKSAPQLSIDAKRSPQGQVITVTDNGANISAEVQSQMFRLFYSTHEYQEDSAHGLGLSLAREILGSYNGTVEYDHTYTTGNRFVITWPNSQSNLNPVQVKTTI
ncbi:MAG: ATP-binding protein [Glaciecola sp.]